MPSTEGFEQSTLIHQLTLGSFLFFLNTLNFIADHAIHSGLVAQIVIGTIYGPPLGNIIPSPWLQVFQELGNLGLVLLVFQGGLSTRLDLLRQNLILSVVVALAGILAPIGLSLIAFIFIFNFTPLQGFTAGAALCSTSLGTTFAILSSLPGDTDLRSTRIGTVLLSAAILDDVVGLIMASVVARVTVGSDPTSGSALARTILQPIVASFGMAIITPVVFRWLIRPAYVKTIERLRSSWRDGFVLILFVLMLSAMVTISHHTGSSTLLGAFVTGCALRYLDVTCQNPDTSFECAFDKYIEPANRRLLVPLFFSSIGAAIPFIDLWKPSVVWKGVVYSILMWLGKAITGGCVLFWPNPRAATPRQQLSASLERSRNHPEQPLGGGTTPPDAKTTRSSPSGRSWSWYPALLLSCAMVARGEIALLIAQIGREALGEEPFLIVMWATVLCTLVGPLSTGWLVHKHLIRCIDGGWN